MVMFKGYLALPLTALLFLLPDRPPASSPTVATERVDANDNTTSAGDLKDRVLDVQLRASRGTWRPEGDGGRAIEIEALGEPGSALTIPAPLLRASEGTIVNVTFRNDLGSPIRVYGLCERGLDTCPSIEVLPGTGRSVRFATGPAGTYHYWATTSGMPQQFRAGGDSQLSGAFIVDPPGRRGDDRVFVITEWTSLTGDELRQVAAADDPGAAFLSRRPDVFFAMNGRVWPHTERLQYQRGMPVRWRVVNLSTQVHPMHLHGFYFDVESSGDGRRDTSFPAGEQPQVVTHVMVPGSTMSMSWIPERVGNWLFHCHVMTHVSPELHVDGSRKTPQSHADHSGHDAGAGMTGMVLGVNVHDTHRDDAGWEEPVAGARKMTLEMRNVPGTYAGAPALAFARLDGGSPGPAPSIPGPTLALTRGEPVEITLVNHLGQPTSIHWHGMELESYYDGVHGFGGSHGRVTPMIEPGESFVVRFTPPRAGTFMYHTHLHDRTQLTSGLYGAMLVLERGETFDPAADHVLVIGRGGPAQDAPVVINNQVALRLVVKAATTHRFRLINITPDDIVSAALLAGGEPAAWRLLTKDGAPVPAGLSQRRPARQLIGVGETYDIEFQTPAGRQTLWLELRTTGGRWLSQAQLIIR